MGPMQKQVGRGIFGSGVVMTKITTPKRGTVGFPYVPRLGVVMDAKLPKNNTITSGVTTVEESR